MRKYIKKQLHKRRSAFYLALTFYLCALVFILNFNNCFQQERAPKQREEHEVQNREEKQNLRIKTISLPEQIVLNTQKLVDTAMVNLQMEKAVDKKTEAALEGLRLQKMEDEKPLNSLEMNADIIKKENIAEFTNKQEKLSDNEDASIASSNQSKEFNFAEYRMNLVKNCQFNKGEDIPLLHINDHDKIRQYREGLKFYGFQLIARPKVLPDNPYYLIIADYEIEVIYKTCPYTVGFPPIHHEDYILFKRLLSKSQYIVFSDVEYELLYVAFNAEMYSLVKSKQKFILDEMGVALNDISGMVGTFKKVGSSYVLIIESLFTRNGRSIKVDDPDAMI